MDTLYGQLLRCIDMIEGSRYRIHIAISHVNIDAESLLLRAFLKSQTVSSPLTPLDHIYKAY